MSVYLGVDVGTGSARAGLFSESGETLGLGSQDIQMWSPGDGLFEQSSDDIWRAVCESVRNALAKAGLGPSDIKGIGFDAACSMAVLDAEGAPVGVHPGESDERNVIVWMDHRAVGEAAELSASGHEVLKHVGGTISPEMQTPKLLWLKRNHPEAWARAAHFFDLGDFLTWRATGSQSRSACAVVCKWTNLPHLGGWHADFFETAGLGDLASEGFRRIGTEVLPIGTQAGVLSEAAAGELSLKPGIPVGTSMIDAHAGGIGVIGADLGVETDFDKRLALIAGTSACHMACSPEARFIGGIWGPYQDAMLPGLWLNEGGQSTAGAAIDRIALRSGPSKALREKAERQGCSPYDLINDRLNELSYGQNPARLTKDIHVLPYFHGNRSPRADSSLKGVVSGIEIEPTFDTLATTYLAGMQAVCMGTRHIIEEMNDAGYSIDTLMACGGLIKNPLFNQVMADSTGCRVVLPAEEEAVLLGSAILGACASGDFPSIDEGMAAMSRAEDVVEPDAGQRKFYDGKYKVFMNMYDDYMSARQIMDEAIK
jgi:FGGY-family pentulose kinase